jgi:DNA-binding NarL/FixJ family response regulator
VAAIAATGKTNRDVATALFISPKTVETNLGRVYRKLGHQFANGTRPLLRRARRLTGGNGRETPDSFAAAAS